MIISGYKADRILLSSQQFREERNLMKEPKKAENTTVIANFKREEKKISVDEKLPSSSEYHPFPTFCA